MFQNIARLRQFATHYRTFCKSCQYVQNLTIISINYTFPCANQNNWW